ncbi:MAG TPA: low-specificity L-threonine aldolase [Atribacteraceae bacterium]|nr:low-specificity L-threonine aldolase [Atribacteraceae bacterium]
MNRWIDLRSDTVTRPTEAMLEAMRYAEVGDDVYGDDPTVQELERRSAAMLGKEAALFVPSGTFGNQLAILTHTRRGDEVLIPESNHIVEHECGAPAALAGVQLRTLPDDRGRVEPDDLARLHRIEDIHYPRTGLVCLENAHSSGAVVPLENIAAVVRFARSLSIPLHLDGARIFNAAVALGVPAEVLARDADSIMFCLSKGLCAPIGSLLTGREEFIHRARKIRKMLGGGMRQAGYLAAAGLVCLETMIDRLAEDHLNARHLAERLGGIERIEILRDRLDINMVFFRVNHSAFSSGELVRFLLAAGIKINPPDRGVFRLVTHYWITPADIDCCVEAVRRFFS